MYVPGAADHAGV